MSDSRLLGEQRCGSAGTPGGQLWPWLQILFTLACGAGLSFFFMRGVAFSGDEVIYNRNAESIARWVLDRGQGMTTTALLDQIVGYGWFVPGVSVLLAPVHYLFVGEAPVACVRAWMILLNCALLALIARELLRSGVPSVLVLVGVSASLLVPYYVCFLGCLWGELIASHAAILIMLLCERLVRRFQPLACATYGAAIGCITLCRPQFFLLLLVVAARCVLAFADGTIHGARKLCIGLLAIVAAWYAMLAPWQYVLQARYGPFFLSTTPSESSFVFNADYLAKRGLTGQAVPGVHLDLVAQAAGSGRSLAQQIQVSRKELTPPPFFTRVGRQALRARKFYFDENRFVTRFQESDSSATLPVWVWERLRQINSVSWRVWLATGLLLAIFPFSPGVNRDYRMPVAFKGLAGLIASQPVFFHAHGRYHVALIPVITIFAAVALAAGTRVPAPSWVVRSSLRVVETGVAVFVVVTLCLLLFRAG